jgi:hypothetical protein
MASEEGTPPIYTSTYLEAIHDGSTLEICVKEPTSNVMSWMDLSDKVVTIIRTSCPAYLRNQPLKAFFSTGPPDDADNYTSWLRKTIMVYFPDDKYHVHPKETSWIHNDCGNFKEFVDEQLTWIPINTRGVPEDSMTPMIGVFRDDKLDPDKAMHIMHITVGVFAVHLNGKKSAMMEFDNFTMSLYEEDMGLLIQAGYIHILGDGEEVHDSSPPNWESL